MKRLLQISLDTLLISILPIIMWIILGFTITKEISNVFSLTYPLQFFYMIFVSLFAIGPNITAKKANNKDVVYSNMIFGLLIVGLLTLILVINVNTYIKIMNMNIDTYHNFCIYSIIWMYFSFIMQMIIQKLYYDDKNNESNKINIIFNLTNFILIIILTSILKDFIGIIITLIIDFLIVCMVFIKYYKKTRFCLQIKENIKYTSFDILSNLSMFLIYGIGFGNSFLFGEKYASAINFESLTTDTQWDMLDSVDTASKIDLAENKFNYKELLKNAYKLLSILIFTILIMNLTLYWYFKPDLIILLIILAVQIIDMLIDPLKTLRMSYIQINDNNKKHNVFYLISRLIRLLCSFIPSAFCTYIGQAISAIYLYVYSLVACRNVKIFKLRNSK